MGQRIGVFGGTFDPPHIAHLVVGSQVAATLGLDRVLFVPTGEPWQKRGRPVTPAAQRLAMTELAVAGDPLLAASPVDVDRPGPTYTVDTLDDLAAQLPTRVELFLVLGADALAGLPTWRDPDGVRARATLVGVARPGHPLPTAVGGDAPLVVEVPDLAISSSDLRARVARGEPIRYLVPDAVAAYVDRHRLYRGAA